MYTNDFWIKHIEFEFEFEMLKNNHFVDNIVKTSNSIEYLTELYKIKRKLRLCLVTLQTCGFFLFWFIKETWSQNHLRRLRSLVKWLYLIFF